MLTQTDPATKKAPLLRRVAAGNAGAATEDRAFMLCGECPQEQALDLLSDVSLIRRLQSQAEASIGKPKAERLGFGWLYGPDGCLKTLGRLLQALNDPMLLGIRDAALARTSAGLEPQSLQISLCPEGSRRITDRVLDAVLDADALSCDSVFGANVFRVALHKVCALLSQPQLAERPRAVNCHPFCLRACKSGCEAKCSALCRGGLEGMACCSGFGTPGSKCFDGLCDAYVAVHEVFYTCMAVEEKPVVSMVPMAAQVS